MERIAAQKLTFAIAALLSLLLIGCSGKKTGEDLPPVLKIGVLPDESREKLAERYEPLRRYLSESLGLRCELVFYENYLAIVEAFGDGSIDLAYFGGLTFVQAMAAFDAVPLVMRDVDSRFTSYVVARADSTETDLAGYKNSAIAFGSRLSTSGHLMPRYFLAEQDITPETFFSKVHYSATHDATVEGVRDGTAEIGVVNSLIFNSMVADGRIEEGEFHIVWETPPYSNYVWAVQPSLGKTGRKKLRDAFLALSPSTEEHEEILRNMGAGGFYPSTAATFSELNEIALEMELIQ
ncbi:MAG: phosphate/phosphite/phosphonate ABC transporter substrate-binding protein [Planctomycetaceae bacterium]|jgi:phosphonate transport system substrate-binding protein|nr:phosphate/phosphite/phosphonate ABC transporter substrate-binding protein [Planctomycetaceae bacterium]MBT6154842.1 phosphate/phosphite/phosphonate ABC transporter substrate-binding protein [Planctomycetaceae bacterium]MBT6486709.1 phosphate/phosphite/phosphonate ABC transporter substrate-binding protein [Planctomycetaceae bacterium]MBT6494060.1 phosphate/phosphite/phosphonate ABC transporter substrate-binding protein [Planctomycetaceae bacterium]